MTWYREWFGEDYLDLYAHRDEAEAREHVAFFKSRVGRVDGPLLDLACGAGRHLTELRASGYDAIGCDLSYVLLRNGIVDDPALRLVRADMRHLPFCDGSFHGLVNFFTSFGYFENEEENLSVVHEMCRVLAKNAPFLFDFMNVQLELARLVQKEEKEIEGAKVLIERWFDASTRTFNKRIDMAGKRYIERVRGYDLDEIATLFTAGGLTIRDVCGDFDGRPYEAATSPRVILIGAKKK